MAFTTRELPHKRSSRASQLSLKAPQNFSAFSSLPHSRQDILSGAMAWWFILLCFICSTLAVPHVGTSLGVLNDTLINIASSALPRRQNGALSQLVISEQYRPYFGNMEINFGLQCHLVRPLPRATKRESIQGSIKGIANLCEMHSKIEDTRCKSRIYSKKK
jgi:hypothetical protein